MTWNSQVATIKRRHRLVLCAIHLAVFSVVLISGTARVFGQKTDATEALRQLQTKQIDAGIQALDAGLIDGSVGTADVLNVVRCGRDHLRSGDMESASKCFRFVATVLARDGNAPDSSVGFDPKQETIVRLTTGHSLAKLGEAKLAFTVIRPMLNDAAKPSTSKLLADILLTIGSVSIDQRHYATATDAYDQAVQLEHAASLPTAMLGKAWAIGAMGTEPAEAAGLLKEFVRLFPKHADAPHAANARLTCLRQLEDTAAVAEAEDEILKNWPKQIFAVAIATERLRKITLSEVADASSPTIKWVTDMCSENQPGLTAEITAAGAMLAAKDSDDDRFDRLTTSLAAIDQTGKPTMALLEGLIDKELASLAERFAAKVVLPSDDADAFQVTPACQESVYRWAGQTSRWTLIAMAAEETGGPKDVGATDQTDSATLLTRTLAIERLFAEALLQTGRTKASLAWWNHIIDVRGDTGFPSLLRCAEVATSVASTEQATTRIDAARHAAGQNQSNLTLVNVLAAELAIRKLDFDSARYQLTNIVRGPTTVPSLRGRAQWLIGETFYMQRKFEPAIDAYRSVEGLDPSDTWTPASLVQAGKAFEQLGRTREATVCYFSLVNRFASSPHAIDAQRRLASIAPNSPPKNESLRR